MNDAVVVYRRTVSERLHVNTYVCIYIFFYLFIIFLYEYLLFCHFLVLLFLLIIIVRLLDSWCCSFNIKKYMLIYLLF